MRFPFERNRIYTIGKLRAFERDFSAARQKDDALSKAWRVPNTPEMKRLVKIREETYPIKLLAHHKKYPDNATFHLTPFAFPGVDAEINSDGQHFNLQITIADPIWPSNNERIQHGGYDNRLMMEALNSQGVVHGSGSFRRDGDRIVCDDPSMTGDERIYACRKGFVAALSRKAKPNRNATGRLLVFARQYTIHIADAGFAPVAMEAMQEVEQTYGGMPFEKIYFVDEREFFEV